MFGEQIVVNIQTEEGELKLPLETTDGERWACDWCVESPEKSYTYYYSVEREGRAVKTEWLMIKHQLDVNAKKAAVYTLYDHWKFIPFTTTGRLCRRMLTSTAVPLPIASIIRLHRR